MKIGLISDLHLEFGKWDFDSKPEVDVIINCGDTHPYPEIQKFFAKHVEDMFGVPYIEVKGNHDFYHDRSPMPGENQTSIEVGGVTFAAATLWTKLEPKDWLMYAKGMIDTKYIEDLDFSTYSMCHANDIAFLMNSNADVYVTHHSPSTLGALRFAGDPMNKYFHNSYEGLLLGSLIKPPKLWIHGHSHEAVDYVIGNTRIISHPRGYPSEPPHENYKMTVIDV